MRFHSQILDNFFKDTNLVRELIKAEPMKDQVASDGVTYPGIVELPEILIKEIRDNFFKLWGFSYAEKLIFARYSFADMQAPNWAHSDKEMADYVGLIYLNPDADEKADGTLLLKHRSGLETHPEDVEGKTLLLKDSNNTKMWDETFYFPARFNRLVILSTDYIHAAASRFGFNKDEARLVITVFFNLHK